MSFLRQIFSQRRSLFALKLETNPPAFIGPFMEKMLMGFTDIDIVKH